MPEVSPLSNIDAVVLTHAHLDHCGIIPLLFKYGYEGPVYMTPPTRDLMGLLQLDYIEVANREGKRPPYDSAMIRETLKHTITLNYGDVTDIAPDVRLTFYNSGHILGSACAHFHIGEGLYNVAFTGDFKYEKTRLFDPAVNQFPRIETVIMEATYGGMHDMQPQRKEAEIEIQQIIKNTLTRGGKVLIPTFAVGRSQEVMIVLEEAIRRGYIPNVPDIPRRHDLGGYGHPYDVPRVPERRAAGHDLPQGPEPVPFAVVRAGRFSQEERGDTAEPGPLHRAGDVGHDERRTRSWNT